MLVLTYLDPAGGARRTIRLTGGRIEIGSHSECQVRLAGAGVAPRHAAVEPFGGGYKVVDLHTEHGTIVNGGYVAQKRLEAGDRIEVGGHAIACSEEGSDAPAALAAEPRARPRPPVPLRAAAPASPDWAAAPEEPALRRTRRGDGKASHRALAGLLVATVVVMFALLLLRFLPEARVADTSGAARAALADVLIGAGKFDRAAEVIAALRAADPPAAAAREDALERARLRDQHAREELAKLQDGSAREPKEELALAREAVEAYGNVPGVGSELGAALRDAEDRTRVAGASAAPAVAALLQLTDAFLAARDYVGALHVWGGLGEPALPAESQLRRAAEAEIEAAADREAAGLIARADECSARQDWLGGLLALAEEEVRPFRGTAAFARLEAKAAEIELLAGPALDGARDALAGGAVPQPTADRVEPRPTADGAAPRPAVAPRAEQAPSLGDLGAGDRAFHAADLAGATAAYEAALAAAPAGADRTPITRRIERAQRAGWFLDALAARIEADPAPVAGVAAATRSGEKGAIAGAKGGRLAFAAAGAPPVELRPLELDGRSCLALAKHFKWSAEEQLGLACLAMIDRDDAATDQALMKALDEPALKTAVDAAIALMRGMDAVPEWGFFRHDGRFVTFREREQLENAAAVAKAGKALDKAATPEDHEKALRDLIALVPVAKAEALALLRQRRSALLLDLAKAPEVLAHQKLLERKAELERRRAFALELIFDEVKYFYPYQPPDVPPDQAALYPKVQQEVDDRVQAVRDLWGNEFEEAAEGAPLSKAFRARLAMLRAERDVIAAGDEAFQDEAEAAVFALLPAKAERLNLRNVALDVAERERLDRGDAVMLYNATIKSVATEPELEQLRITNHYRLMMGRQALALHDKLVLAARSHSDWMSRTGKFSHFEDTPQRRTPRDRILEQGYSSSGSGENIALNSGALPSHVAWCHSAGHHRNILYAGHSELGVGAIGRYWTQNFAGGGDYAGNLQDLGF